MLLLACISSIVDHHAGSTECVLSVYAHIYIIYCCMRSFVVPLVVHIALLTLLSHVYHRYA